MRSSTMNYQAATSTYKTSMDALLYAFQNMLSPYPKHVSVHLSRVYGTITILTMICVMGVLCNMYYHIGGIITQALFFGSAVYLIFTYGTIQRLTSTVLLKRGSIMALNAFLLGCSISPLISHAIRINPSILVSAITLTSSTFLFLSLTALFAQRRVFFVLGALISNTIGLLSLYSLLSFFFPSYFSFSIQLYGGLLVLCASILYSTQLVAERAAVCDASILKKTLFMDDALLLFWDLVDLFVRILIILMDSDKKNSKKRDDERRSG